MTLARRILIEKRVYLVPLAVLLLVNIGVYVLVVQPLRVRSATAADRAASAAQARQSAERDAASARALVVGKTQADQELAIFYQKVLPANQAAARRMTYAHLPALARKANLKENQRTSEADEKERNTQLGRLRTRMLLEGDYEGISQFIYDLETTPEFIIIDDVMLSQSEANRPLTLTLELSTYYRQRANGT